MSNTMTPAEVLAACAKFEQMAAAEVPFAECMEAAIGAAVAAMVAENSRLREAIKPLADIPIPLAFEDSDTVLLGFDSDGTSHTLSAGDIRAARSALGSRP